MDWAIILEEWASFIIRWVHAISGIAWIGSSFYFIHLDLSLKKHDRLPQGAGGDAWQVHGGGFYHMTKYLVAPPQMPAELTWFKWEAYTTFISGIFMLGILYYWHAELYLIDKTVWDCRPGPRSQSASASLIVGWVVYDLMCKSPLGRNDYVLLAAFFVFLVAAGWGFTKVFSGRGAFIQLGALIGTAMVANVAMIIIPNQRKVVAALMAGQTPDPKLGAEGKQRSLHNNYLTLPVLFLMLANHYPLSFATQWNWVIAALVLVIGGVIRHFYNVRHSGGASPWWTWAVAAFCMLAIMWLSARGPAGMYAATSTPAAVAQKKPSFADVQEIMISRCSMCHAKEPVWAGIGTPPKGVMLDTPETIRLHAREIALQTVHTHAMPPGGNITDLSDDDRRTIAAWLAAGAPVQ